MKNTALLTGCLVGIAIMVGGCGSGTGQNNLVTDVQLRSYQQGGDTYVEVSSLMNLGNTQLVSFEIPIVNPHNPAEIYGKIAMRQAFQGGAEVALAVNFTTAVHLNLVEGTLPNGTVIPVGGLGNTPVIGIPIGNSGARVYLAYGPNVALLGFAIPIKELDATGAQAGYVNIFPMFDFGKGVRGIAGIFTGLQSQQSGIAFFVDAGAALNPVPGTTPTKLSTRVASLAKVSGGVAPASSLEFQSVTAGEDETQIVNTKLYKLHRKRTVLHPMVGN